MKLAFLALPADERRLYIEQAAVRRNISPVVLEKDFWVCWLLGVLFESEFAGSLVFKGGTSLSKVFGVIERSRKTSTYRCPRHFSNSLKRVQVGIRRTSGWRRQRQPAEPLCKTRSGLRWKRRSRECWERVSGRGSSF